MLSRFFIAAAILLNATGVLFPQTVRLTVFTGGNLDFIFNSISKYKNGITYTNYSTVGIRVVDAVAGYTTWRISVYADDTNVPDGLLTGTVPANTLSYSVVEVQATGIAACAPVPCPINLLGSPWVPLAVAPGTVIVNGTNAAGCPCPPGDEIPPNLAPATDQIRISYRCGVSTSLLGRKADFYSDDIILELVMNP